MDPFIAEIRMFAGNFAPRGWAFCNGQLLPISQNTALFSLLGTTYGGDGRSTFALPNLQGASPIHHGQGLGLTDRVLGEAGGAATVTLLTPEMPAHTHSLNAASAPAERPTPESGISVLARSVNGMIYRTTADGLVLLNAQALAPSGGDVPHNNRQPYLGITCIIALQGIFPSRS